MSKKNSKASETPVIEMTGKCLCSCGADVTKYFAPGHEQRAILSVVHGEFGGVLEFLKAHGYPRRARRAKKA